MTSQARLVITKAWRRLNPIQPERVVKIIRETPMNRAMAAAAAKTCQSAWPTE